MKFVIILLLVSLVLVSGCIDFSDSEDILNFNDCIEAGYPAMESYPRQCRDELTDRTFTEEM